jgi:hypothetical protein
MGTVTRTLMDTLINAYVVSADADQAFIAAWKRTRVGESGPGAATLHRALRAAVALRFVDIARVDAGERSVADPGGELPFTVAHPGVYEVTREDGEPEGAGGVVLITFFEVREDERFVADRERLHEVLVPRQGYLGSRLHRSLEPADFGFVDIMRWSSPLMFARALQQPEIAQAAASAGGHRALYLPVSLG